jgi:TetR/AcrR family transcriptional regulator, transcriptional repressor for nem operon
MARHKEFDQTRALDKALDVFWHKGYEATSVQDLVEGMGISRQSLYDTYGDKHALFLAALDRYIATNAAAMCNLVGQGGPVKPLLRQLFEGVVQQELDDPLHKGCMAVNAAVELAAHDKTVAGRVCNNAAQIEGLLRALIERGQQSGEVTARHEPQALARFLFSSLQGLRLVAKANPEPQALREIMQVTLAALD